VWRGEPVLVGQLVQLAMDGLGKGDAEAAVVIGSSASIAS
jgi:hypothetical protein